MNHSDSFPRHEVSASKAAAAISPQSDSNGSFDLEVKEDVTDKLLPSTRKERAEVKVQYGKKTKFRASASPMKRSPVKPRHGSPSSDAISSTSMVVSTSSHRPGPHPTEEKSLSYLATGPSLITESDGSDLTSLSSSASPIDNDVPGPPLCTPPRAVPLLACRGLKFDQLAELNEPVWSANDLGSYVWVLLEPKSNRVYDPDRDENDCKERLWWPAKVCVCFEVRRNNVYPNCHRSRAQETLTSLSNSLYLDSDLRRWKSKPHPWKMFCPNWT